MKSIKFVSASRVCSPELREFIANYPMRGKRILNLMQTYKTTIAPIVERMRPAG